MTTMYPSKMSGGTTSIQNSDFIKVGTFSSQGNFNVSEDGWYYVSGVGANNSSRDWESIYRVGLSIKLNNVEVTNDVIKNSSMTSGYSGYDFVGNRAVFLYCYAGDVITVNRNAGSIQFNIYKYNS